MRKLRTILESYLACALWTEDIEGTIYDVLPESKVQAEKDILAFITTACNALTEEWTDEQIGHDLWLTRNGHGAGFWDRPYPNGKELTDICRTLFKGLNVFLLETGRVEIY